MPSQKLSERIKQANSSAKDVDAVTEKLGPALSLQDKEKSPSEATIVADASQDDEDWEAMADKELEAPEPVKAPETKPKPDSSCILELYNFDPKLQMHQLVKSFTNLVDPTGTMSIRPKMVGQSLLFTFSDPKHAKSAHYSYSCSVPPNPLGQLRFSDGNPSPRSSTPNNLPPAPAGPPRTSSVAPSSRPLTTDSVARRFITGHLGIKAPSSSERREYDRIVRAQAQQQKEERERQRQKEKEDKVRQEQELRDVWEQG